jgi:hypothetical protein
VGREGCHTLRPRLRLGVEEVIIDVDRGTNERIAGMENAVIDELVSSLRGGREVFVGTVQGHSIEIGEAAESFAPCEIGVVGLLFAMAIESGELGKGIAADARYNNRFARARGEDRAGERGNEEDGSHDRSGGIAVPTAPAFEQNVDRVIERRRFHATALCSKGRLIPCTVLGLTPNSQKRDCDLFLLGEVSASAENRLDFEAPADRQLAHIRQRAGLRQGPIDFRERRFSRPAAARRFQQPREFSTFAQGELIH